MKVTIKGIPRPVVAALGVVSALLFVLTPASAAQAADWHNISGETFSNTDWFVSDNIRDKEGTGDVRAEFSNLINHGPLRFCVHNVNCQDFDVTNNEEDVAFLLNGTEFRNSFRALNSCSFLCDNVFSGREWY